MILRRVELRSAAKVTAAAAVVATGLAALGAAVLYVVGSSFGVVKGVDRVAVRVFNDSHFHLGAPMFIAGAAALAAVLGVLAVIVVVICATIYNRIGLLTGGLSAHLPAAVREGRPAAGVGRPAAVSRR